MKTKEFIEEARDLGLFVEENKNQNMIWIKTPHEDNHVGEVKTNKIGCRIFDESKRFPGISRLIYEYGMSPLEEREEEKKYVYKLPILSTGSSTSFIQKFFSAIRIASPDKKVDDLTGIYHFTDKEVEQYAGKSRLLFDACEKIEVTP